jgi:hypothetical protein
VEKLHKNEEKLRARLDGEDSAACSRLNSTPFMGMVIALAHQQVPLQGACRREPGVRERSSSSYACKRCRLPCRRSFLRAVQVLFNGLSLAAGVGPRSHGCCVSMQMAVATQEALEAAIKILGIRYLIMKRAQESGAFARLQQRAIALATAARSKLQIAIKWHSTARRTVETVRARGDQHATTAARLYSSAAAAWLSNQWLCRHVPADGDCMPAVAQAAQSLLGAGACPSQCAFAVLNLPA